jgi:Type VI secretion system, TssC, VipB
MPRIEVIRKGITPAARSVPKDTTLIVLPMTLDRVGKGVADEEESPVGINSVADALAQFKPMVNLVISDQDTSLEFTVNLEFRRLVDFNVENVQRSVPGRRNDIASLKSTIDVLWRLKDRWASPAIKRVWNDPLQRKQILAAISYLRHELEKIARDAKADTHTKLLEISAVAETPQSQELLIDIFSDIHPRLVEEKTELVEIFTPDTSDEYLNLIVFFESLFAESRTYEQSLQELQTQIHKTEQLCDRLLARLYEQLRPIEASYRQLWLFYENSFVPDGRPRAPVEVFVFNADTAEMTDRYSGTLDAIRKFVSSRNDNFNFRDDICNLVIPGPLNMEVRAALEEEAWRWGMLLITDLADEKSYKYVITQFRPGGRYEFLKRPDDKAASDVVTVGYLKLRDAYSFENYFNKEGDLYAPASVIFAGALARTDRVRENMVQGPIGPLFGQIRGVEKARIECSISEMESLSQEMQLIPVIRDSDNNLCFYGSRSLAEDPYGVYKFFTAYRVLSYIERVTSARLRAVAGQILTREFIDEQIDTPLRRMLEELMAQGTILQYELFVDMDANKRMQGICDINLEVMPTGPAEIFRVKIDVPDFKPTPEE